MKRLLLPIFLAAAITGKTQTYGGGTMGMAFGKTWNGKAEVTGPQAFFFALPVGWQSHRYIESPDNASAGDVDKPHLLIEGQGMYSVAPVLSASIGLKMGVFELLAGAGDQIGVQMHPFTMSHYIAPMGTARLVFGHFYISGQYYNGSAFIGVGLKAWVNE